MKPTPITKGDRVTIQVGVLKATGEVLSAEFYGEDEGWYIEMMDDSGIYKYWKQAEDDGEIIDWEPKEEN